MDFSSFLQWLFEWSSVVALEWGYLGMFVVSLVGNATILFPIPAVVLTFTMAPFLNPWILGAVAGLGAAIGELTGYALGRGGSKILDKKNKEWLKKAKKWEHKHGMFIVIFLFALTPLPDDIVGILAGLVKYDLKHFFIATLLGKLLLYIAVALAGFYGIGGLSGFVTV